MLIMKISMVVSARRGEVADANPWRSRSPEFQIPSPIPERSYPAPFVVVGEPYDYGKAGAYVEFLPSGATD